jgi:hypothetical protein
MRRELRDARFEAALARFEAMHREDPRSIAVNGESVPWSVHYHRRLRHWVEHFSPDASEALQLAAACQHIRRWEIPRGEYGPGRREYRRWRSDLAKRHAEIARGVLAEVGYDEATIARVEALLKKLGLSRDPEVQLFEDAICMVFFENEYAELARKHEDAKLLEILSRTWAKMSERGRAAALELAAGLPERERRLIDEAVALPPTPSA